MRREYRALLRRKREQFWQAKVEAEKSTPRQLWLSQDAVLGRGRVQPSEDKRQKLCTRPASDYIAQSRRRHHRSVRDRTVQQITVERYRTGRV